MSVGKEERKMSLGYDKSRAMLETGLLSDCQFEVKFLEEEPEVCNFFYYNRMHVYVNTVNMRNCCLIVIFLWTGFQSTQEPIGVCK
jgi:hypothetical protein